MVGTCWVRVRSPKSTRLQADQRHEHDRARHRFARFDGLLGQDSQRQPFLRCRAAVSRGGSGLAVEKTSETHTATLPLRLLRSAGRTQGLHRRIGLLGSCYSKQGIRQTMVRLPAPRSLLRENGC
jgi:hypothetical protein